MRSVLVVLGVAFSAQVSFADAARTPLVDPPAAECISHRSEARVGAGYDHLVHVTNRCTRPARCEVSTDVNPATIHVVVAPRSTETVLTFRGSPAREFTARVVCRLQATN